LYTEGALEKYENLHQSAKVSHYMVCIQL